MASRSDTVPVSAIVGGSVTYIDPETGERSNYHREGMVDAYIPNYLSASDYSNGDGGLVRANYNVFVDEYAALRDKFWWLIHGGHGTFGVAVLDDAFRALPEMNDDDTDEQALLRQMLEALQGLENYPYLEGAEDEEFQLRMELEIRQWGESYGGAAEFATGLIASLDLDPDEWDFDPNTLSSMYRGLSDVFNVNVEFEGSGDNLTALWYFDKWFESFNNALAAWQFHDAETGNPLVRALIEVLDNDDVDGRVFEWGGWVNNVFRFTRDHTGYRADPVVFKDWILEHGGEEALRIASKKDAKLEGFGALRRDGQSGQRRYIFRGRYGELYGITPALWDNPNMTVDEAREALARTYSMRPSDLEFVREAFNEFTEGAMESVLRQTYGEPPEAGIVYPSGGPGLGAAPRRPRQLMDIAQEVRLVIERAEAAGVVVDDGNVVDLLADNLPDEPLSTLRAALAVSGVGHRFPRATSQTSYGETGGWAVWTPEGMNEHGDRIFMREGVFATKEEAQDFALNLNRQPGLNAFVLPAGESPSYEAAR